MLGYEWVLFGQKAVGVNVSLLFMLHCSVCDEASSCSARPDANISLTDLHSEGKPGDSWMCSEYQTKILHLNHMTKPPPGVLFTATWQPPSASSQTVSRWSIDSPVEHVAPVHSLISAPLQSQIGSRHRDSLNSAPGAGLVQVLPLRPPADEPSAEETS
ncbi:unnamed protein product [Pleuronectes platessa]|uniref:Uncharacterized protein n=1 Tax=Pleuronectes platessa TaxID=8262 RepID=A0A9N7YIY6_PLEPL|nr:unnamed protein product [Pleuronectes platessa]